MRDKVVPVTTLVAFVAIVCALLVFYKGAPLNYRVWAIVGTVLFGIVAVWLVSAHEPMKEASGEVWATGERFASKADAEGLEALSDSERTIYCAWALWMAVDEGGLEGFYSCPFGELAARSADALERIGAHESSQLLRVSNGLFSGGSPPGDGDARRAEMAAMPRSSRELMEMLGKRLLEQRERIQERSTGYQATHREELLSAWIDLAVQRSTTRE
jgi:hypothetical protein